MNNYPEVVAKIAKDYLERVKSQLRLVPVREQNEFLREIESHLYEAYQQTPGEDDVARILAVLRNLGEPAEVVSDRLAGTMVRSGTKRNVPLYVVGGILIALFGIPLGFGGLGVLVGILAGLAGMLVAFYATAGSILLVGALFMLLGLTRTLLPHIFEKLVVLGLIQFDGPTADFLDHFSPSEQGLFMILFASLMVASGFGMLRLGKYVLRGLRFLFSLLFDRMRRFAQLLRRTLHPENREAQRYHERQPADGQSAPG
ncbi:MAG TPA: DUF1700 domain-containing protein [Candidatus Acidoferrales bacterium]|jgi:uncharacterized membrane protein|nr:DUF1700 domain-containing protein [Candidatus Acidoferrales bacterium]